MTDPKPQRQFSLREAGLAFVIAGLLCAWLVDRVRTARFARENRKLTDQNSELERRMSGWEEFFQDHGYEYKSEPGLSSVAPAKYIEATEVAGHVGEFVSVEFKVSDARLEPEAAQKMGYLWAEGIDASAFTCVVSGMAHNLSVADEPNARFESWIGKDVTVSGTLFRDEAGRVILLASKTKAIRQLFR